LKKRKRKKSDRVSGGEGVKKEETPQFETSEPAEEFLEGGTGAFGQHQKSAGKRGRGVQNLMKAPSWLRVSEKKPEKGSIVWFGVKTQKHHEFA